METKQNDTIKLLKCLVNGILLIILSILLSNYAAPKLFQKWGLNKRIYEYHINRIDDIQGTKKEVFYNENNYGEKDIFQKYYLNYKKDT